MGEGVVWQYRNETEPTSATSHNSVEPSQDLKITKKSIKIYLYLITRVFPTGLETVGNDGL